MKLRWLAAAFVAVIGGCSILESGPGDDLNEHRRAWSRLGISNYTFDYVRLCFCGGPAGDTLRIVVRGDSVVSVENRGPRAEPIQPSVYTVWVKTIDGLFDELKDAIDEDADQVDVQYDRQFSYPRIANIDFIKRAIDDEMRFEITRFTPNQ